MRQHASAPGGTDRGPVRGPTVPDQPEAGCRPAGPSSAARWSPPPLPGCCSHIAPPTHPPTTGTCVAASICRSVPGSTAADLGTVAAELPDGLSVVPEQQAEQLVGRVTRMPLRAMDLIRPDDLVGARPVRLTRHHRGRARPGSCTGVVGHAPGRRSGARCSRPTPTAAAPRPSRRTSSSPQIGSDDESIGSTGRCGCALALSDTAAARPSSMHRVRTEVTLALPSPAARHGDGNDDGSPP